MTKWKLALFAAAAAAGLAGAGGALADEQATAPPPPAAAPAPPAPTAMSTPAMGAVLSANGNPFSVDASPIGKIYIGGAVTGLGLTQSNAVFGDESNRADLSNAQVFIQKTDGPIQFFIEAGGYSLPSLGASYIKMVDITKDTYGVVPVAYLKIAPTSSFNVIIGKLPTLIGQETTFTFQNNDIERGLLWNQEPAVSRGVQANYSKGPLTVSVSLNDGFYSNRYDWISGLISYAITPADTLVLAGGGNFDHSTAATFATPFFQNNGDIFNVIFTHAKGPLAITPYFQYTHVPARPEIGIFQSASTYAGAVLAKYSFTPKFSVAVRGEYESSTGNAEDEETPSLLYGVGSKAWSLTVTPTYQWNIFFVRAELSYTKIEDMTPGFGFGQDGLATSQVRGLLETGVLF